MTPAQGRENVAVFNPLVLALPNWHPDGPDGTVDGFVIPFVMPPPDASLMANRHARIEVRPDDEGRWAAILSNVYMAGAECVTAEQARALAGAWIRAAEVLENVATTAAEAEAKSVAETPDNDDGSCGGCGAAVDDRHAGDCPVYLARLRTSAK